MPERSRISTAKSHGPDPQRLAEARGERGAFNPDGSWWPDAENWNDLTRWLNRVVHARRTMPLSPAKVAARIAQGPHSEAFHPEVMRQWLTLTEPWQWPCADALNSAEETVKHAGYGPLMRWHPDGWAECTVPDLFTHRLPARPLTWPAAPAMQREHVLDAISTLFDRFDSKAPSVPAVGLADGA